MHREKSELGAAVVRSMRHRETLDHLRVINNAEISIIGEGTFEDDLASNMLDIGHGYDPYNYIGGDIVAELIGVERGPRIGKPIFAVGDMVACVGDTDLPHGADKERDETKWPGSISAEAITGKWEGLDVTGMFEETDVDKSSLSIGLHTSKGINDEVSK